LHESDLLVGVSQDHFGSRPQSLDWTSVS